MPEPEDPIAEPVEPQPAPGPPAPETAASAAPRRSSPIGPVIGGVLAAALGFGLAQYVPNGWPITDTAALEAKLAAQADDSRALAAKIAELPKTPVPDQSLTARIDALESTTAPDLTGLDQRLTALEQRLTAIEALPKDGTAASTAVLAQLQSDMAALKSGGPSGDVVQQAGSAIDAKLAEADAKIAAIKTEAEATAKAAAARAAMQQIAAALDSGAPFAAALTALPDLPPILTDNAKTGLPTQQGLSASFPDAARAALEASLRANMGETWTARVSAFLRNQTGARSLTPRDGTDPDAVLSRAEAALNAGDLATVLKELAALPPAGKTAMATWQALCAKRQAAISAVQSLSATLGG